MALAQTKVTRKFTAIPPELTPNPRKFQFAWPKDGEQLDQLPKRIQSWIEVWGEAT
jgi:hypothetical protein